MFSTHLCRPLLAPKMADREGGTGAFTIGAVVALRADPSRTGPVIAELDPVGERRRFRVYHSADEIRDYLEDQLLPSQPVVVDEWRTRSSSNGSLIPWSSGRD